MTSDRTDTGAGDLAGWIHIAAELPLPDVPILVSRPDGRIVWADERAVALTGAHSAAELVGRNLTDFVTQDGAVSVLHGSSGVIGALSWPHTNDPRLRVTALFDVSPLGSLVEQRQRGQGDEEVTFHSDLDRLHEIERATGLGIWEWRPYRNILRVSRVMQELTGRYGTDQYTADDHINAIHPDDRERVRAFWKQPLKHRLPVEFEYRYIRPDGEVRHFRLSAKVIDEANGEPVVMGTSQDITDQRRAEEAERYHATHDDLTGLPNRAAAAELLRHLLSRASPRAAVLNCDIDNFQRILSSLGHAAGDELLIGLSRRLERELPPECTPTRPTGTDEFGVICADLGAVGGLDALTRRLSDLIKEPVSVKGHIIRVSAAIGAAVETGDEANPEDLLRFASAAAAEAKRRGPGEISVASPKLMASADWQLLTEGQLRAAVHQGGLTLHYQPVVNRAGKIIAAEALVRWPHPEHGLLNPGAFLPVAEQGNLMREIDLWVLRRALADVASWQSSTGHRPRVAINLAAFLPSDADFVDTVTDAIRQSGLDWNMVAFELVEKELAGLASQTRNAMEKLIERGVEFAIDDFGTGYSSLARLKELPAQAIKIDRQFVAGIEDDASDFAVTRALVDMTQAMGLHCVAEGVETRRQFHALARMGVNSYQGWLFSRPLPEQEFRAMLRSGPLEPSEDATVAARS